MDTNITTVIPSKQFISKMAINRGLTHRIMPKLMDIRATPINKIIMLLGKIKRKQLKVLPSSRINHNSEVHAQEAIVLLRKPIIHKKQAALAVGVECHHKLLMEMGKDKAIVLVDNVLHRTEKVIAQVVNVQHPTEMAMAAVQMVNVQSIMAMVAVMVAAMDVIMVATHAIMDFIIAALAGIEMLLHFSAKALIPGQPTLCQTNE